MASTGVEGDASPGLPVESQPDTVPDPPGQGTAMAGCTFEEARFAGFGALSGRRVLLGHLLDDLQDAVENKQNRVADLVEVDMKDRDLEVMAPERRYAASTQAEVRAGLVEEVEGLKRAIEQKKKNIMALFADK